MKIWKKGPKIDILLLSINFDHSVVRNYLEKQKLKCLKGGENEKRQFMKISLVTITSQLHTLYLYNLKNTQLYKMLTMLFLNH